jgi:hypothetical protein
MYSKIGCVIEHIVYYSQNISSLDKTKVMTMKIYTAVFFRTQFENRLCRYGAPLEKKCSRCLL